MANFGISILLLGLCLVGAALGADTCCPDAWLPYQGSCYLFHDEEKIDWTEAVTYCNQRNSELVAIETQSESKFLKYYARKLFKHETEERNSTAFWLGATDRDIEGIWKWFSKDEELTYTEWDISLNQPNTDPDNHEDCLALNGLYNFGWHDGMCSDRIGYPLCEKPGSGSSGQVKHANKINRMGIGRDTCCPNSWFPYKGSCYLFYNDGEKMDWNDAEVFCKQINSELVAIETESESRMLEYYARKLYGHDKMDQPITAFWLGATDRDTEGVWKWVSKDEVLTYTDWDISNNKPSNDPNNQEDCVVLAGLYNFTWHDGLCTERVGYPLCEKPSSGNSSLMGMQIIG